MHKINLLIGLVQINRYIIILLPFTANFYSYTNIYLILIFILILFTTQNH